MGVALVLLTPGELNKNKLLFEDNCERWAWHVAAVKGKQEALHILLHWTKKLVTREDI
jgi:hypothetical protein